MFDRKAFLLEKVRRLKFGDSADAGSQRLTIRIAGVRIALFTASAPIFSMLSEYFNAYRDETPGSGKLDAEVWLEAADEIDGYDALDLWEDVDPEFLVFQFGGDCAIQRDFAGRLSGRRAVVLMPTGQMDSIHNFLRWLMPVLLLERQAFLMHGGAVIYKDQGYAFFGQSGAGKSTTVDLICKSDPEAKPVGDDAIIVELGEKPMLHSAPLGCGYSREAPKPASVPLKGLYALKQDSSDYAEPLTGSEGAAALLASAMNVRMSDSVEERLELASRFARSQPGVARLHLRKSPEFWSQIKEERL
jgi:hypothetical protein